MNKELENFLLVASFVKSKDGDKYILTMGDGYSVDAYINGKGIIFHLKKDGNDLGITIQQDEYDDMAKAFNELMKALKAFLDAINKSEK